MAKYILMDETINNGDVFTQEFNDVTKAIETGNKEWAIMTAHDKNHTSAFYVLESVNPDENADDHFDGNYVKIWKHDGLTFDFTVDIKYYTADGYRNTETIDSGTTKNIFTASDWVQDFDAYDDTITCVECTVSFWLSGQEPLFNDPIFTDTTTEYF